MVKKDSFKTRNQLRNAKGSQEHLRRRTFWLRILLFFANITLLRRALTSRAIILNTYLGHTSKEMNISPAKNIMFERHCMMNVETTPKGWNDVVTTSFWRRLPVGWGWAQFSTHFFHKNQIIYFETGQFLFFIILSCSYSVLFCFYFHTYIQFVSVTFLET